MSSLYVAELSDVVWVTCASLPQSTFRSHNFLFHLQTQTTRRLRTVAVPSSVHKSGVICVSFTFESHPHIHTSIRQIWFIQFPALTPLYMTLGDERRVMEIFHSGDMNRKCHSSIILAFIVVFLKEIPIVWGQEKESDLNREKQQESILKKILLFIWMGNKAHECRHFYVPFNVFEHT